MGKHNEINIHANSGRIPDMTQKNKPFEQVKP